MTRILIAAAAALAITGPVFAQSNLERQLGVAAGEYSTSTLAAKHFAQSREMGDGPIPVFTKDSGVVVSTSNNSSAAEFARRHFAESHETGDGPRYNRLVSASSGNVILSTSDSDLAAFAREKLANDGNRGNN
ncbi:MAG: hypothetical protein AAGB18_08725 [Pseudomonadota bacterium]